MILSQRIRLRLAVCTLATTAMLGCNAANNISPANSSELQPGGLGSVPIQPFPSLMLPARNLAADDELAFHAGKALAHQPWVKAPTVTDARDGLGPLYNARTCLDCHINGGRSRVPDHSDQALNQAFVRLSLPGTDLQQGAIPEPSYGDQLQTRSVALSHQLGLGEQQRQKSQEAQPEAQVFIDWQEQVFEYPDGEQVTLRQPKLRFAQLGYGPFHPETRFSLRNAPPIHGMGLLELIPQSAIDAQADPKDLDQDGISGRVNQVWDFEQQQTVPGRFGLKANRANNLRIVVAAAFAGDVGISNPVFSQQPCTATQLRCQHTANGNNADGFELPNKLLDLVTEFNRNIGVPKRQPAHLNSLGRSLFYQVGCQHCHTPSYTTAASEQRPHLGGQHIWPYSDLLLHDMGEELADHRSDYLATGREWRTAPLWSVGLGPAVNGSKNLLHDGRARSVEEAILWHGGEAAVVQSRYTQLPKSQRTALIQFVESL